MIWEESGVECSSRGDVGWVRSGRAEGEEDEDGAGGWSKEDEEGILRLLLQ